MSYDKFSDSFVKPGPIGVLEKKTSSKLAEKIYIINLLDRCLNMLQSHGMGALNNMPKSLKNNDFLFLCLEKHFIMKLWACS